MGLKTNVQAFRNWPMLYLARHGFIHRPYRLHSRSGLVIEIRPDAEDAGVVKSVFARRSYVSGEVSIPRDGVVLDVGANIGAFSVFAAATASRVYAFEPETRNLDCLRRNIALNGFDHVTAIPMAVSSQTGVRELHVAKDRNSAAHSLHLTYDEGESATTLPIETVSLPDFMDRESIERIDYLKLDCEGAEWEILETLPREIASRILRIAMETHPMDGYTDRDAVRLLEGLGYRTAVGRKANYLFALRP